MKILGFFVAILMTIWLAGVALSETLGGFIDWSLSVGLLFFLVWGYEYLHSMRIF